MSLLCRLGIHSRVPSDNFEEYVYGGVHHCRRCPGRWRYVAGRGAVPGGYIRTGDRSPDGA